MLVRFTKKFSKQYDKADRKIKRLFDKKLGWFLLNPFHPQLNNHQLTGKLSGYRSINITGDWRAVYFEYTDEVRGKVIVFEILGTHNQLYK